MFLPEHSFVDLISHGEGEQTATAILENAASRDWSDIPGITYRSEDGSLIGNPKPTRMRDLSDCPSPYLDGVFDPLMKTHPEETWIALWETNRGCPFSCTFCDWGSAVQSKVNSFEIGRLHKEIDWFAQNKIEFIFCCDANFGILPRDLDIARYVAEVKGKLGYPHALSVQNTKNATDRAYSVQKILYDAGLSKGVDIALQSTDETTLASIKRANISSETYQELQRRFARDGIETFTDMIIGLPGETFDSFADGVSKTIENGQHNRIQFSNLSILPNAEMGNPEYQRAYGIVTVESKAVNKHGPFTDSQQEIDETQHLVVATDSMPSQDWVKARIFAWTTDLLHFAKTMTIPLIVIHEVTGLSYRELIEGFVDAPLDSSPILRKVRRYFRDHARNIQDGGSEYTGSEDWLNMWWPADEYMLIQLCTEGNLNDFYVEAEALLINLLQERSLSIPDGLLREAIQLNQNLIKLPFQTEDLDFTLSYNVWEIYQGVLTSRPVVPENKLLRYRIDRTSEVWSSWSDWCREVIWYGNKRGAYLYGNERVGPQLAGHH